MFEINKEGETTRSSSTFKQIAMVEVICWEKGHEEVLVRALEMFPLTVTLFSPFLRSITFELSLILSHLLGTAVAEHPCSIPAGRPSSIPMGQPWSS